MKKKKMGKSIYSKSLIALSFFLLSFNLLHSQADPVLSNFYVDKGNNKRIYFKSNLPITGNSSKGFVITGNSVTGISINSGKTSGHYLMVARPITYWDNNMVYFTGGSSIKGSKGGTLKQFNLQFVENRLAEPNSKGNVYYVSTGGSDNNSGTSLSKAWKTLNYASEKLKEGDVLYVESGEYKDDYIRIRSKGSPNNPIKVIGFKKNPGDVSKSYFKYGKNTRLSSSEMPLLSGRGGGRAIFTNPGTRNIIVKNIQLQDYEYGVDSEGMETVYDNLLVKDCSSYGIMIKGEVNSKHKVLNSVVLNGDVSSIRLFYNYNLVDNCEVYGDDHSSYQANTDYYISLYQSSFNTVRNSYIHRSPKMRHTGHGISIKGSGVRSEYNLLEDCHIDGPRGAIEFRHSEVRYSVARSILVTSGGDKSNAGGIKFQDGASYNTAENCVVRGVNHGILFKNSGEDRSPTGRKAGFKNKVINSVFEDCSVWLIADEGQGAHDNSFINNTIYNNQSFSKIIIDFNSTNVFMNNIVAFTQRDERGRSKMSYSHNNFFKNNFPTPNGSNHISKEPDFRNPGKGDFRLDKGSPMIDQGKSTSLVVVDKDGNSRPQGGGQDLGAFEYEDGSKTPPENEEVKAKVSKDQEICSGEEVKLTASGGSIYLWSNGETTESIKVSPSKTTTYTVEVSDGVTSDTAEVEVEVVSFEADAGEDVIIVEGDEVELTASEGDEYLWSNGKTTQSITVHPSKTKEYTVTIKDGDCEDTDSVVVIVEEPVAPPPVVASVSKDQEICPGQEVKLTASGGSSYLWSNGETTESIKVSPSKTKKYTVEVSDGLTSDTAEVEVEVVSFEADAGEDVTIVEGDEVELTASEGDEYLWSNGKTTQSITVHPSKTKTFSVTVTQGDCEDTDEVIVIVQEPVAPPPVVAVVSKDQEICPGDTVELTASGGTSYLWSNGETTESIKVSPSKTKKYTVEVSDGLTSDTAEVEVEVISVVADAGEDVTITDGDEVELTASEGDEYLWSNGKTTQSIKVHPSKTKSFSVTITRGGCEDTDEVVVIVEEKIAPPAVVASISEDQEICVGETVELTASGGTSYLWSNGKTSESIKVSPSDTATYSVEVSDGLTSDTAEVEVKVISVVADAGEDVTIEDGEEVELTASGGDQYLWSNGKTSQSITVNPSSTKVFSVTVTKNGCEDTDEVVVRVKGSVAPPAVVAGISEDQEICAGDTVELTANGGTSYLWSNGKTSGTIKVSPSETTIYSVEVSDGLTSDKAEVEVKVASVVADAGEDVTIDEGEEVVLTANGGGQYLWSNGMTTQSITVKPSKTKTFSVTVTQGDCEDTDEVEVRVEGSVAPPAVVAGISEDQEICAGDTVELTASGGSSYLWSNGKTSETIKVSPTETTTYSVEVSDGLTSDKAEVEVKVASVVADAGEDVTIDEGEEVVLTANGGGQYLWSNGETTKSIKVSPLTDQDYSVVVYSNGCQDEASVKVFVEKQIVENGSTQVDAGPDVEICQGESVTLTASEGFVYNWNPGGTTRSVEVSPLRTTKYTLTAFKNGIMSTDEVIVNVRNCDNVENKNITKLELLTYPNPSTGQVKLNFKGAQETLDLFIFDMNGRVVLRQKISIRYQSFVQELSLSHLPKGVYLVSVSNAFQKADGKIILI